MRRLWLVLMVLWGVVILFHGCTKTKMHYGTFYCAPVWNIDGSRIYYFRNDLTEKETINWLSKTYKTTKNEWYICSFNVNGGDRKEILKLFDFSRGNPNGSRDVYVALSFSPIGNKIAYELSVNGQLGIFILDLSNLTAKQVSPTGKNPSWSPDGSRIVYNEENGGIWTVDTTGLNKTQISDFGWEPKWSPAGEWIVFGDSWNLTGIWKIRADGTDSIKLKDKGTNPVWNRTGDKIAYLSYGEIAICDTNGLNEEQISGVGGKELSWALGIDILYQSLGIWKLDTIAKKSEKILSDEPL